MDLVALEHLGIALRENVVAGRVTIWAQGCVGLAENGGVAVGLKFDSVLLVRD